MNLLRGLEHVFWGEAHCEVVFFQEGHFLAYVGNRAYGAFEVLPGVFPILLRGWLLFLRP